jgi:DNA polymerase-3 subunit alpha
MSNFPFTHFHLHSEYSLSDGIVTIGDLVKSVKAKGMEAVALTDKMNLFAAVKFYKAALSAGVKPILGCDVTFRANAENAETSLVFLCQNETGYRHLTQMLSRAYTDNQDARGPWVNYDWLSTYSEGLIVLSGGLKGDIGQAILNHDEALLEERLTFWSTLFPDRFYLEMQRLGKPDEDNYCRTIAALAKKWDLPLIATNDIRFLEEEDFEAHEARVCIYEGKTLEDVANDARQKNRYSPKQYLRTPAEMQTCFQEYPEAIENTGELAKRCNVHIELGKVYLPNFPVPSSVSVDEYLTQMSNQGLEERLQVAGILPDAKEDAQPYYARLKREVEVIHRMGFSGYFLIVADFIQWAKNNQIPVGPGRGSGAGSLVAYVLKITDLDPLVHDLLFERFLNPERVSMPDFDIDFCIEGRDRVIDYVTHKYGREKVAQIITYGTMAAKAVVRDVGRVLGHPYGFVDQIAKLIPFELGMTLDKAMEQEEELKRRYDEEEEVKELLTLALKLEGITRNVGKHAGGVVIGSSDLTDFSPLFCEPGGENRVTQFDKGDVESVGLVKFDFLGLKTLTIINHAVQTINRLRTKNNEPLLDITLIPTDDVKTFEFLKTSQTTALFQLESRGMRELVHRLQLDCFDDIMALVALYRPGPLQSGMVDDFIDRKQGRTPVEYPHPDLENVLKPTYGVILYQEQVMQIAQILAGYTLGGADILRSAMGKKKVDEMAKQRKIFVEGSKNRGVDESLAAHIFDLMEKFAGYGFNKSHSAAYALVSYQTAWLKAHYPAEFMAAVLSADLDNTDKIKDLIAECQAMHLTVKSPNLNESDYHFTVNPQGEIVYGLGAIKGIGKGAVDMMLDQVRTNGPFKSLFDLCQRVDLRKVSRKVLEGLIGSGACDTWGINRGILIATIDKAIKSAERLAQNAMNGQQSFFSLMSSHQTSAEEHYAELGTWNSHTQLQAEKEKLGFYMSGHPFEAYRSELSAIISDNLRELDPKKSTHVTVGGLIVELRKIFTKRGKKMAILTIDDGMGKVEIAVFSELLESTHTFLKKDEIVIIQGEISIDAYSNSVRMRADSIMTIPTARESFGRRLLLNIKSDVDFQKNLQLCYQLMNQYATGKMSVQVIYHNEQGSVRLNADPNLQISPENAFLESINQLPGFSIEIEYV